MESEVRGVKNICAIKIKEHNGEEVLEDLTPAFPCASGRALLDRYRDELAADVYVVADSVNWEVGKPSGLPGA